MKDIHLIDKSFLNRIDDTTLACVLDAAQQESVAPEEWLKSIIEIHFLKGTSYRTLDAYLAERLTEDVRAERSESGYSDLYDLPINEFRDKAGLPFSTRILNGLRRYNIVRIGTLCCCSEYNIKEINGFAATSLNEIKEKLADRGLSLGKNLRLLGYEKPHWMSNK